MQVKNLLKTFFLEIERRLERFIITTMLLSVASVLFLIDITMIIDPISRIMHNQAVLSVKESELFVINTEYYKLFWTNEEMKNYYEFITGLSNEGNNISSGLYFRSYINQDQEILLLILSFIICKRHKSICK